MAFVILVENQKCIYLLNQFLHSETASSSPQYVMICIVLGLVFVIRCFERFHLRNYFTASAKPVIKSNRVLICLKPIGIVDTRIFPLTMANSEHEATEENDNVSMPRSTQVECMRVFAISIQNLVNNGGNQTCFVIRLEKG